MAFTLLPDELWTKVEPLLPTEPPKPLGGRPRVSDRQCLRGIIFVLRTGMPWRFIPQELGCGSGVTCWRRLRDWTEAGVWPRLLAELVDVLGRHGQLDASLAVMDSASFRALFGGATPDRTGPNPTDRGKNGCKRHVLSDAHGTPLVVITTPANVNDGTKAIDLLDAMPPVAGPRGRPRQKPDVALGDRAYGSAANVTACQDRGIYPALARPRTGNGSGLGILRYVIERTMAWFGNFRRLRLCYERTGKHLQALHELAATLICAKKLRWL